MIICGQKLRGFPCLKKEMLNASGGNVKCLGDGRKKLRKYLEEWKIFCIFASCLGSQIHTEVWITDSHRDD